MNGIRNRTTGVHGLNPESNNLMTSLLSQFLNDMNVLTRKVLMNEKNPHLISSDQRR